MSTRGIVVEHPSSSSGEAESDYLSTDSDSQLESVTSISTPSKASKSKKKTSPKKIKKKKERTPTPSQSNESEESDETESSQEVVETITSKKAEKPEKSEESSEEITKKGKGKGEETAVAAGDPSGFPPDGYPDALIDKTDKWKALAKYIYDPIAWFKTYTQLKENRKAKRNDNLRLITQLTTLLALKKGQYTCLIFPPDSFKPGATLPDSSTLERKVVKLNKEDMISSVREMKFYSAKEGKDLVKSGQRAAKSWDKTSVHIVLGDILQVSGYVISEKGLNPLIVLPVQRENTNKGGAYLEGKDNLEADAFRRTNLSMYIVDEENVNPEKNIKYDLEESAVIYCPGVTVFRSTQDEAYHFLETPYHVSIAAAPAIRKPAVTRQKKTGAKILTEPDVLKTKNTIHAILSVGLQHDHDSVIFPAWGAEKIFECPPKHTASIIKEVIQESFKGKFKHITFADTNSAAMDEFKAVFLFAKDKKKCSIA